MPYGKGIECSDKGVQSASNLKYSGTVEPDLGNSKDLGWISTEDTSNCGIGHTRDVDSDRNTMEMISQFFLDIELYHQEQDSSEMKHFYASWDPKVTMCKEAEMVSVMSTSLQPSEWSS